MSDPINPPHYKAGGIETIDAIEAACAAYGPTAFLGLLVGNVIKYVSRAPLKGGVEDLRKARWYLDRLIAAYETRDEKKRERADSIIRALYPTHANPPQR
jgi:hypothetical protein